MSAGTRTSADRIFLVGPMGSGKTTIGRRLAPKLGLSFIDLDEEIERRCGVEVTTIFDIEGESGFRQREHLVLDELSSRPGIILATGGGSVMLAENRRLLAERGLVIYLSATVDRQLARLERDKRRPLLQAPDRRARLEALAHNRNRLYEEVADLVIPCADIKPPAMAARVEKAIKSYMRSEATS